ncbi:mitogen-activated protein kinase kinase kinase 20-like [Amphiura filiformis]|uniref:mitogen-activated protein kinase kinase kinase 20-like n=1 Tax=Amphiura filiformis TaxID=82378 RepID=UPI003B2262BF
MATPANHIKRSDLKFGKQIGEGGYSSVFQMTWISPSLGPIQIAAKRLNKRDVRELEIMSGLDHPNIVKLLGVVDEEIDFMLILELCDRGSLRSHLQELNAGHLSEKQFYDWAEQAARPLQYLRQKRIIHKDVKSPNYMITAENNLKLGDFGIAKNIAQTIDNATETASYPWMAPELLSENILSLEYDIFAFAVVLWEMRTGKFPFQGLESQVIAWKVCQLNERLSIPEDCPQAIKELMMRCWETDWTKRPCIEEVITVIATAAAAAQEARQKIIITGPWKLEKQFGHQDGPGKMSEVWGIAVNPRTKDVAVADFGASQVKVYSWNGEYKFSMDTTQGLEPGDTSYPFQVTVNSQGTTYFVTDLSNHVKFTRAIYSSMGVIMSTTIIQLTMSRWLSNGSRRTSASS